MHEQAKAPDFALTHRTTDNSGAKAIAAQQDSVDSLPKIVFDGRLALDYLLALQAVFATVSQDADLA